MVIKQVVAGAIALSLSGAALADTVYVDDVTTFGQAVAVANANPAIDTIEFDGRRDQLVTEEVHYLGPQDLTILGGNSVLTGNCSPAESWGGGLFASYSAASISISDLTFETSCNNGVGVFIPANAKGDVEVALENVSIKDSRFHGLYVDNQDSTGSYNTDDVPHPDCFDPWPYDSKAGVVLVVRGSDISSNGNMVPDWELPVVTYPPQEQWDVDCEFDEGDGWECEIGVDPGVFELSGCPADFDGIRVDDGGPGGITATILNSVVSGNLADGVEYDERGQGDVDSYVGGLHVEENGETEDEYLIEFSIENYEVPGTDGVTVTAEGEISDLDDGFDIDEEDNGELYAYFEEVFVNENRDEGLDLDEAGNGSATVMVDGAVANGNEDQGIKVDESNNGDLWVTIVDAEANGSRSQHGTEFTEEDNGSLDVAIIDSEISRNDDGAVAGEQDGRGYGLLTVLDSDLAGNDKCSFDELDGSIDVDLQGSTTVDDC
jgi:hypothetical protein